jgi:hypothetical protein
LTALIGVWVKKRRTLPILAGATISASVLFFLITNFGVWAGTQMYSKDLSGLLACYTAALPFFRNTLAGDVFYTGIFFGLYEIARSLGQRYLPEKLAAAF